MTSTGRGIDGSLVPHPAEWIFGGFGLVGTLLPVLVGLGLLALYVRSGVPRVPLTTAPAAWAAGRVPSTAGPSPVGQWNARVTPQGHREQDGVSGVVRLENGWFGFHVAGVATPTWLVPTTQLRAGLHSVFSQAEVWIDSEQTGRLNLTVSHEPRSPSATTCATPGSAATPTSCSGCCTGPGQPSSPADPRPAQSLASGAKPPHRRTNGDAGRHGLRRSRRRGDHPPGCDASAGVGPARQWGMRCEWV